MKGHNLLLEGTLALAEISNNGIRVDVDYYRETGEKLGEEIGEIKNRILKKYGKTWRRRFGEKTNINSRLQLGTILFDELGFPPSAYTPSGKYSTAESDLESVRCELTELFFQLQKKQKVKSTYIDNLLREQVNGFIHPFFNLGIARTMRSSSDRPNFQNIPIRDAVYGKLVRRGIIPRPGHRLVETDYSAIEVRIAACYHHDPKMLEYIRDSTKDMHRDMASQIYCIPPEKVSKMTRHCGKNMFVFPAFYGSVYNQCAGHLWEAIETMKLETTDGIPIKQVLHENGIKKLGDIEFEAPLRKGTFVKHMKEVETDFWENRFSVYNDWRQEWYAEYLRKGFFKTLTGFTMSGPMLRNKVINYPIQGSAFHCLLLSLILLQKELKKRKMETKIIGQIHDSIVADVAEQEFDEYIELSKNIMEQQVPKIWDWIIVPLNSEIEVTEINQAWDAKKEFKIHEEETL